MSDPNVEWRERQQRERIREINEQIARNNYEGSVQDLANFLVEYRLGSHKWSDDPYKAAEELLDQIRLGTLPLYCPCGRRMSRPECGSCDREPGRD